MNKKLTITIDDSIIDKAQQYAKSKGKSLSEVIEGYLKSLSIKQESTTKLKSVSHLKGSIKVSEDFNYKNTLEGSINLKFEK